MQAVIFDIDGTLVDSERHGHRIAFNRAFEAAGLPDRWDEDLYGELLHVTGGRHRIEDYLAGRGVAQAERAELAAALHDSKTAILEEMVDRGVIELRPGAGRLVRELAGAGVTRAVGTTGSRRWVARLLRHTLGDVAWDAIVTGDDVTHRKPDPEVFVRVVEALGVDAGAVVVVEDSAEGLEAARAAGLCCVVVVNGYTAGHDLDGADLVVDGFGEPGAPAAVLADPHGAAAGEGILTAGLLRTVLDRAAQ